MGDDVAWDLVDKLAPCMLMLSARAIGTSQVILRYCVPNLEIMLKFLKHADVKWEIEGKFLAVRKCSCSVLLVNFSFLRLPQYMLNVLAPILYVSHGAVTQGFPWQQWKPLLIHHRNMLMLTTVLIVHTTFDETLHNKWQFNRVCHWYFNFTYCIARTVCLLFLLLVYYFCSWWHLMIK